MPRQQLLRDELYAPIMEHFRGKRVGFAKPDGNAGDVLIRAAATQLFERFGINWEPVWWENPRLDGVEIVAFCGGGNLGTLWGHQGRRARLASAARKANLKIVVMPQSIHDETPEEFGNVVFARDRVSQAMLPGSHLAPDLALAYDPGRDFPPPSAGRGYLLREDQEALLGHGYLLREDQKALLGRTGRLRGAYDPSHVCRDHWDYLHLAAKYAHVVTDRLHMAIAALIVGREVTLLPNSYHKNLGMFEAWLKDLGCMWRETVPAPAPADAIEGEIALDAARPAGV